MVELFFAPKWIAALLVLSLSGAALAQESQQEVIPYSEKSIQAESERFYREMVERLNQRYNGFFERRELIRKRRELRRSGANEHRKKRQQWRANYEKARQEHILNRKEKEVDPRWELEWLELQEKKAKLVEKARKAYVVKRDEVENVRDQARKIPERLDVGLDRD